MNIIGLADIHGNLSQIDEISDQLSKADLVLLIGDITNFGRADDVKEVIEKVRKKASGIVAVSGNCDFPEVDDYLNSENLNFHGNSRIVDGICFVGVGGSLVTPFKTPNEISEDDFKSHLDEAMSGFPVENPLILVSHQPPFQTSCDVLSSGDHVGSKSVRHFIEDYKPLACFTGHIHESRSIDKIGMTYVINPGPLWQGHYAVAEINNGTIESADIVKI
ncbi:MAG: YfcE family phosphodiesterase [Desulfobacterales bacterium]|nr:YfcE family phosphodiesterase [Desulfobacteraceae bacterium]MBT4363165.1 YfcE family phosphodiesterase [Desulfobacteraceae bacterium]MBT7084634.1 YfcE family phosphodiesterase [Desulfobacterales bacterium]MBT7697404.1 YfcE family phosphodiesterase [Desulfobacterales bacterium]